jgi:DNA-binding LacI/PurR family transcriptional regulator
MARIGIAQIAKRAKVSKAAVSRALRGQNGLSEPTRRNILKIAKEIDYIPRRPASLMRKVRILTPQKMRCASSHYFRETYEGLCDTLLSHGVELLHVFLSRPSMDGTLVQKLRADWIDVTVLMYDLAGDLADYLTKEGFNVISLLTPASQGSYLTISYDNVGGMQRALEHLVAVGKKEIGYIYARTERPEQLERLNIYREFLRQKGLGENPKREVTLNSVDVEDGEYGALQLLEQYPQCDAALTISDRLAFGVCRAMQKHGKKIPEDIGVIGFDDEELARYVTPALTTIRVPYYKMAVAAGKAILDCIDTGELKVKHIIEPTQLQIRSSTQI